MSKLLFIQPTQYAITKDGLKKGLCKQKIIHLPGLVFPLLAAMTPDNWDIEIKLEVVDNIDYDQEADLIGIGSMGYAIYRGIEIASEFIKRGKTVIMGGYMTSMAYKKVLEYVDSVIIGDAEISYPLMLKEFEKTHKLQKIYNYPINNLKKLPVPKYELLINKPISNMLPVQAGRGCTHNCSFCSIACLYKGKYLSRPIDEVMRDINRIKELGFNRFYLIDDNIVSNPKYLEDLCREIEPLKMKWATQCDINLARKPDLLEKVVRAGAYMMSFGIEGISQEGLDKLNKSWLKVKDHEKLINILSNAGILVSGEMMVGTDGDTEETIRNTYEFLNKVKLPLPRFYILTPTPGTKLFDEYKKAKRLLTEDFSEYSGSKCVFKPENITSDKLTEMYWWINKKIFTLKSILKRTIFNVNFLKHPLNYIFAFFVNLHYRKYIKKGVPANIF
ncbi:MAG: B12-binding domain-containing radical SAM protein [Spirochaetes bacterium]|nr:B12-binding domain-containing radical SAM protein [Spirochaetota bacterium]